jgi:hypothetical protein
VRKKISIGERRGLEIDPFEIPVDLIVEEHLFEERRREVAGEQDPFAGDESVFDRFEERERRLLVDVPFDGCGLTRGVDNAGELAHAGFAGDPLRRGELEELMSFDDEHSGEVMEGSGSGLERFEKGFRIFKGRLELVAVCEEDVFAVRLEGVELKGDVAEFFLRRAKEFVDVAGGFGVGLKNGGAGVVDAFREEFFDNAAEDGADVERKCPDEEDLAFFDEAGSAGSPELLELEEGAGVSGGVVKGFSEGGEESFDLGVVGDNAVLECEEGDGAAFDFF